MAKLSNLTPNRKVEVKVEGSILEVDLWIGDRTHDTVGLSHLLVGTILPFLVSPEIKEIRLVVNRGHAHNEIIQGISSAAQESRRAGSFDQSSLLTYTIEYHLD